MDNKKFVAKYFFKTKKIIKNNKPNSVVTLQFFQRHDDVILCGMNEVLNFLKENTDTSKYSIKYLPEGSKINNLDIVLELEGHYQDFGIFEGVIDGILARQTSLATNAYKITKIVDKDKLIFMGDRADHYLNQSNDGYAIACGGIKTQVTDAQIAFHDGEAIGTIPHALIQMFEGNLSLALKAYEKEFPNEKLVALVDFNNNVIEDSLKIFNDFKNKIFAIRVDTSSNLIDRSFINGEKEYGVTPFLIKKLRAELDDVGAKKVKIIVSSSFNEEKIKKFVEEKAPVDFYGIGASLLKVNINFTCDATKINGKKIAKFGRLYRENLKLIKY